MMSFLRNFIFQEIRYNSRLTAKTSEAEDTEAALYGIAVVDLEITMRDTQVS